MATTVWNIANPAYMRSTSGNTTIPYYSFAIQTFPAYPDTPVATAESIGTSILNVASPAAFGTYLLGLYSHFLNVHGKRFAKPYTPTQLIKVTTHSVEAEGCHDNEEYEWILEPIRIDVKNGTFCLFWKAIAHPIKIQLGIEDEVEPEPEVAPVHPAEQQLALEEVTADILPPVEDSNLLRLTSNSQLRDKKTVEEARIRAKWAQYKAEKAIAKYLERYGDLDEDLLSDSSGGESGDESSD
jgi:hypothetical protein